MFAWVENRRQCTQRDRESDRLLFCLKRRETQKEEERRGHMTETDEECSHALIMTTWLVCKQLIELILPPRKRRACHCLSVIIRFCSFSEIISHSLSVRVCVRCEENILGQKSEFTKPLEITNIKICEYFSCSVVSWFISRNTNEPGNS